MIIAISTTCDDDAKKSIYAKNLKKFLDDYLQYCKTSTASSTNVIGILEYIRSLVN